MSYECSDITIYNRISGDSTHYDTWHPNRYCMSVHVHVDHKDMQLRDNGLKQCGGLQNPDSRGYSEKQGSIFRRISSLAVAVMDTGPYRMMIRLSWESVRLRLKSLQI